MSTDEVLDLAAGQVIKGERAGRDRIVEKGIELRHNRVHLVASAKEVAARPYLLMRLFLASAKTGAPIHHRTRKIITASLGMVDVSYGFRP